MAVADSPKHSSRRSSFSLPADAEEREREKNELPIFLAALGPDRSGREDRCPARPGGDT